MKNNSIELSNMSEKEFDKLVEERCEKIKQILSIKAKEYD